MGSARSDAGVWVGERFRPLSVLKERGRRLATGLANLGVRAGDAVALLMWNDFAYFEAMYAARWLGFDVVPINYHLTVPEVACQLNDCRATAIIVHDGLIAVASQAAPSLLCVTVSASPHVGAKRSATGEAGTFGIDLDSLISDQRPWEKTPARRPAAPVTYTSGTTGRPKGVVKLPLTEEQRALQRTYRASFFGARDGMRTLVANPLYHVAPYNYSAIALSQGGTVVLQPTFDPEGFLGLIALHRVTHLQVVPTMFVRLLQIPHERRSWYDVSTLEHVIHGAAPCPATVKREMLDWWGPIINEYYGSTETGGIVIANSSEWLERPGTVGRARDGAVVRIYDDDGVEVAVGSIGTIYVSHPAMPGFTYRGDPAKRASVERDGLVTSGDLGYLDGDGYLYLVDRRSDLILCGGSNVYPAEVEAELMAIEGIADCGVVGIHDEDMGQVPCAVVQLEDGASLESEDIAARLRSRLASYKIPRKTFVVAAVPREPSGKLRRTVLRNLVDELTSEAGPPSCPNHS